MEKKRNPLFAKARDGLHTATEAQHSQRKKVFSDLPDKYSFVSHAF